MRNNTLIVRRDPFRDFDTIMRQAFSNTPVQQLTGFAPAAESYRDGDDAVIRLEVPGMSAQDVAVEVLDGKLTVCGERKDERAESSEGRSLREFRYGTFTRSFRLPQGVKAGDISASYDAGILSVRIAGAYVEPVGQKVYVQAGTATTAVVTGNEAPAEQDTTSETDADQA